MITRYVTVLVASDGFVAALMEPNQDCDCDDVIVELRQPQYWQEMAELEAARWAMELGVEYRGDYIGGQT